MAIALTVVLSVDRSVQSRALIERTRAWSQPLSTSAAMSIAQGRLPDLHNLLTATHERRAALNFRDIVIVNHLGVVLGDGGGTRFGENLARTEDTFVREALQHTRAYVERFDGLPTRIAVPIDNGIRWGTLVVVLNTDQINQSLSYRRRRFIAVAFVLGVLSMLVLLGLLSRFIVRPVRELSHVAVRLAQGDLDARVPLQKEGRELEELGNALNQAAHRLQNYTQELEDAVSSRTQALARANDELREANANLELLAITDGLTTLYNHRHFQILLEREFERQRREGRVFAVLMIDVDDFKHYNDNHGHPAGDELLVQISKLFRDHTRATDIVARYGGEEFSILLLGASFEDAMHHGEKIRQAVSTFAFHHAEEQPLGCVSVSIGVASWPDHGDTPQQLLEAADRALYRSKRQGRNCVSLAGYRALPEEIIAGAADA